MIVHGMRRATEELPTLLDRAARGETVIVKRRGRPAVALIADAELRSMRETLHLLSSPANGLRLLRALPDAANGQKGVGVDVEELRARFGLYEKECAPLFARSSCP